VFLVLLVGELQGWTVRPWPPRLPALVGQRSASVLGPTRGGIADVDYSPPFKVLWGDTPTPPAMGAPPPWPPVFPPPWAKGPPASWAPLVAGLLRWATHPFFLFCGGTPPRHGGFASWPPFPTLVGLGFAGVLGPTRGGVANVDNSPLILVSRGALPTMMLLTCLGLRNDVKRLTKAGLSW